MKKKRDIIIIVLACIAFFSGIGLCIGGFFVPPQGEISGSVLTFLGECLTFAGSVFGIGSYTSIQIAKIRGIEEE